MKLSKIFKIIAKPSNSLELTELDIYNQIDYKSKNYIPVISSKTEDEGIFGYIPLPDINLNDYSENTLIVKNGINYFINKNGCLTVTKDGSFSGFMIARSSDKYPIFSITGHGLIMDPLDKTINIEWFKNRYQSKFMAHNSDGENNHFGKSIYEEFDLNIPSNSQMVSELNLYQKLNNLKSENYNKINEIEKILNRSIQSQIGINLPINDVLDYIGRNDNLTELGIYLNQPKYINENKISVLSGTGNVIGYISDKTLGVKSITNKPILSIITRGRAGVLTLLPTGDYAGNTNTYPLFIKDSIKKTLGITTEEDEIDYLLLLKLYLQQEFIEISSNGDLGVFPLDEIFNKRPLQLKLPYLDDKIKSFISQLKKLLEKKELFENKIKQIDGLLTKEIV